MTLPGRPESWAWAGFIIAPACWFTQQIVSLLLTPADCAGHGWIAPAIGAACVLVLVAAALLSWRGLQGLPNAGAGRTGQRARFVGIMGTLMPPIFLLVMLWQLAAILTYSGCER